MKDSNPIPLPSNFLVEQATLNLLLTNTSLAKDTILTLKPEIFYFEPHRIIYETIIEIEEKNLGLNLTGLITSLHNKNLLKKIGGIKRLTNIINPFESFSDLDSHISELKNKYLRRTIIETGKKIIAWGYETSEDLVNILGKIEDSLSSLSQERLSKKADSYGAEEIMIEVFNDIQLKRKKTGGMTVGLNSSFKDLDSILQGFQKSDLIIVAGRPSMGKTAFSLNIGKNIVEKYNVPLLIFSLEMSRQQIMYRFLSTDSNINASRLKSANLSKLDLENLNTSMNKISKLPIFIDDNPNLTLTDIRLRLRKIFTRERETINGLVIVDYLQLMKLSSKLENRVQEISHITRNLKILAKEFQIPIIVLSQLSRNLESRTNKRPMLSDLRESGCIANNEALLLKNKKKVVSTKLFKIKSWNQDVLVNTNLTKFDFKGVKPTFLITFNCDKTICLTSNHRILSKDGWIRASQIQKNTEIYCLVQTTEKTNKSLLKYNYFKIKNITYQGIKEVYDKTIVGFHNYLSKDIVLHNSIEQDADIVIMIYREEYYNDNPSEEQITEIIVAKHRNGPVGTAKLLFNPSVTSFVNL